MGFTDQLKYQIDVDSARATSELRTFDGALSQIKGSLTGGLTSALGSMAGPAGIAAGAVAAIGTAAVVVGKELFDLSNKAAEFGGKVYDMSVKTGLSAKAISAMSAAAKQSDTSMEQISGGVAKFSKLVGAAADGSKEAAATLKQFGLTPQDAINDLEGSLSKVFKQIEDAEPGIQRTTLAQKAFGKSGADLLPFIDQINGDLPGTIKYFEKLGLTISDKDAKAADDFGDQMGLLHAQLEMVGIKIGTALIPVFQSWATKASDFFARNQGEITRWGQVTAKVIEFVASVITNNIDAFIGYGQIMTGIATLDWSRITAGASKIGAAISAQQEAGKTFLSPYDLRGPGHAGGGAHVMGGVTDDDTPGKTSRSSRGLGRVGRVNKPAKDDSEQIYQKQLRALQAANSREIAETQAKNDLLLELDEYRVKQGIINEKQLLENRQQMNLAFLHQKAGLLQLELDQVKGHKEDELRVESELKIAMLAIENEEAKQKNENADAFDKKIQKQLESFTKLTAAIQDSGDEVARLNAELGGIYDGGPKHGKGGLLESIFGGTGMGQLVPVFDELNNRMLDFQEHLGKIKDDIVDFVGQGIGGMIAGLGQMAIAWAVTGEGSAKAAMQMMASTALSIAVQAFIKGAFELAEAAAAAARYDFAAATMHTAAAKLYYTVSAIATGVGVGLAIGARSMGGGKGGASAGGGSQISSSKDRINQNPTPYSRQTDDAFISGSRNDAFLARAMDRHTQAVEKLNSNLDSMRPGDVLTKGMAQKPGLVGQQVVNDIKRNSSIGSSIMRSSGMK